MRGALIRIGLAASGLVYVAMGVVSARVAFLGARNSEEGVPGALRFLLEQRNGAWVLGAVVAGLVGIALAHAVEATRRRGLWTRLGQAVAAISYAALAWTAARLLLHLGRGGPSLERSGISWLLSAPGGEALLEIAAVAVIAGGLWEMVQGLRGPAKAARPPRALARGLGYVARFGLFARGSVLFGVGYFLFLAAEESDPRRARTLGGVLRSFSHTALGPWLMGVIGLGLAAYGVHLWSLALWKRKV